MTSELSPCSVVRLILQIVCSVRLAFKTVNLMWLTPWSRSLEIRVQIPAGAPLFSIPDSISASIHFQVSYYPRSSLEGAVSPSQPEYHVEHENNMDRLEQWYVPLLGLYYRDNS